MVVVPNAELERVSGSDGPKCSVDNILQTTMQMTNDLDIQLLLAYSSCWDC